MFEKLKRAKSFIGRTRTKQELDLSETSHLRRAAPINNVFLLQQRSGTRHTTLDNLKKLSRKTSVSYESVYSIESNKQQERAMMEGMSRLHIQEPKTSHTNHSHTNCGHSHRSENSRIQRHSSMKNCEHVNLSPRKAWVWISANNFIFVLKEMLFSYIKIR